MRCPERQPQPIVTMPLADTKPLEFPEADLSQRLMQTAHTFVEKQIKRANADRQAVLGNSDSAEQARRTLRTILGVVDERLPPRMEHFGDEDNPAIIAKTDSYEVLQVRWPVLEGVDGEGLLIRPLGPVTGRLVLVPDADQTPEDLLGLASSGRSDPVESTSQRDAGAIARQLAEGGFEIIVPAIVSRAKMSTDDERRKRADFTYREWIYRQAFQMGRHVIGYDLARVLACVDWFESLDNEVPIGIAGYGEGDCWHFTPRRSIRGSTRPS